MQIPLKFVYVHVSGVIPLLEYLGERASIKSILYANTTTSACVQEMISKKVVHVNGYASTWEVCVNISDFNERDIDASFTSYQYQGESCANQNYTSSPIVFSDYYEGSGSTCNINYAQAEWILYVSYFYNKEERAQAYMDNLYGKFTCLINNLRHCNTELAYKSVAFIPG